MQKKSIKFASVVEFVKLNFTYITVLKYKAGPGFDDQLEHPPVQIILVVLGYD